MLQCHRAVAQAAGVTGDPMCLPVMPGPLDLLSAFRGPTQFCLDLYDCPDEVHKALKTLTDFWIEAAWSLADTISLFHNGMCSRMHLWFPMNNKDGFVVVTPQVDTKRIEIRK